MPSDIPPPDKPVRSIDGIIPRQVPIAHDGVGRRKNLLKLPRQVVLRIVSVIAFAAIAVGIFTFIMQHNGSLPSTIKKQADFPIYYPSPIPNGYAYLKGSAKIEKSNVVFYTLHKDGSSVEISEQPAPINTPDLGHLSGFTSLQTVAGSAAIGTTSTKQPVAIIVSNTTLTTITGNSGLPSDIIAAIAQNMRSLSQ